MNRCHSYRISSKSRDIFLNPLQTKQDILNSLVAVDSSALKSKKPQWPESVVDGYYNCIILGNVAAVVECIGYSAIRL